MEKTPSSQCYQAAFAAFLSGTDQKRVAGKWLSEYASGLSAFDCFIDAGAGNGELTEQIAPYFRRTIAVEPNPGLRADLVRRCPQLEVLPHRIEDIPLVAVADFVLCSHVLYLIPHHQWISCLRHLMSWLRPGGSLLLSAQNRDTDCKRMLSHFGARPHSLQDERSAWESALGVATESHTIASVVRAHDLPTALQVGEFILNNPSVTRQPSTAELEAYLLKHHRLADGSFRLSCDQDMVILRQNSR